MTRRPADGTVTDRGAIMFYYLYRDIAAKAHFLSGGLALGLPIALLLLCLRNRRRRNSGKEPLPTLPFLLLTPGALLAAKMGLGGLPLLGCIFLAGCLWMLYLLVRTLEAVYLVDGFRAAITLLFSLLLLYIVFVLPWQIGFKLVSLNFFDSGSL